MELTRSITTSKMRPFLFLCLVMAVAGMDAHNVQLSQAQKDKVHQYTMQCIKESGVKPDIISEAKKGHFTDDEGLKKFTLCFFQKSGIVDSHGKLNVEAALAKLPPGINKVDAMKLLEECKKKTGKDAADTAFEVFKCYSRGTKTHILV